MTFKNKNSGERSGNNISLMAHKADLHSFDDLNSILQSGYHSLAELICYEFKRFDLFIQAVSHSSFVHEFKELELESNERLEFLGDAVLDTIVSTGLMAKFPTFQEGQLSKFRAALVNERSFAELARSIRLQDLILLGKGELQGGGDENDSILSDAFEALIGAIYLDQGFEKSVKAFHFILENFEKKYGKNFFSKERLDEFDPKSRLQEKLMSLYKTLPEYNAVHDVKEGFFNVKINLFGRSIAEVKNISKKQAERELALLVLKEKRYLNKDGELYVS